MYPKIADHAVVFREFPDEITLALNFSGCPCKCEGCHSPYLRDYIGEYATPEYVDSLIDKYPEITCVGFMGGDAYPEAIVELAKHVFQKYPHLKLGWYRGVSHTAYDKLWYWVFTYLKFGEYIKEKGPLDNPKTNQRMWWNPTPSLEYGYHWEDITERFWNKSYK